MKYKEEFFDYLRSKDLLDEFNAEFQKQNPDRNWIDKMNGKGPKSYITSAFIYSDVRTGIDWPKFSLEWKKVVFELEAGGTIEVKNNLFEL